MNPYVRGYRRAARHLMELGLLPAPCRDEMRILWANSPEDRRLVAYVADNWEMPNVTDTVRPSPGDMPPSRTVAEQLRLRRTAAWRSPRLSCGHRDPISRSTR